jgi:hypothetical protein
MDGCGKRKNRNVLEKKGGKTIRNGFVRKLEEEDKRGLRIFKSAKVALR